MTSTSRIKIPSICKNQYYFHLFSTFTSTLPIFFSMYVDFFSLLFNSKSSIDLSLKDWDVKEQENLREVQKILDRTDEILEVMRFECEVCWMEYFVRVESGVCCISLR